MFACLEVRPVAPQKAKKATAISPRTIREVLRMIDSGGHCNVVTPSVLQHVPLSDYRIEWNEDKGPLGVVCLYLDIVSIATVAI